MKKILLLITFALGSSYAAFGATCGSTGDTLADYISAGSCTIMGTDLTFSGFNYTISGDSIPVPASDVTVTPTIAGPNEAGFVFNAPWVALSPELLDADITYTVGCSGCELDDWVLEMGGAALAGDEFANVGETSTQVSPGLSVGATASTSTLSDSASFAPVGTLSVDKDLTIYGGSSQNTIVAKVSSVTNLFSTTTTTTTPEPSLTLLCVGVLGLVPLARRRIVR